MNRQIVCGVILLALFFPTSLNAHTTEERRADLAEELKKHFDPVWIERIFNHQNLCEGYAIHEKSLSNWRELQEAMMSESSLLRGEMFFRRHESMFRESATRFDDCEDLPYVILAILRIETDFGRNRSGAPVAETLFRKYHRIQDGPAGNYGRSHVFKHEILPFFRMARENRWNICEIRGSRAAAFGYPQFIPGSLRLAVDGDGDDKVDIVWNLTDASHSIVNYLVKNGYSRNHRKALFRYNRSWRYVNIVWQYAIAIKERIE